MRVLVTGGTGFVGSHTVAALVAGGHEIRLLVRSPDRIAPTLRPLGITDRVDHMVSDVTDPRSVARGARKILPFAWAASKAHRVIPFRLPVEYEGDLVTGYGTRCDNSRAHRELGVQPRPLEETYRDTVLWLYRSGHLTARQAGATAQRSATTTEPPSGIARSTGDGTPTTTSAGQPR